MRLRNNVVTRSLSFASIGVFLCCAFSSRAYAQSTTRLTPSFQVAEIVSGLGGGKGTFIVPSTPVSIADYNPAGCRSVSYFGLAVSSARYNDIFAILLQAHSNGKTARVWISGKQGDCVSGNPRIIAASY